MFVSVFRDFLNDFAIAVRRGDGALNGGSVKGSFVFEIIECFDTGLRVDFADLLAFFQEYAVDSNVGTDRDWLVIDKPAVEDACSTP